MLIRIMLSVAFAMLSVSAAITDLRGFVPPSVTQGFAESQYFRIWHILAPDIPCDTTPIVITFFTVKSAQGQDQGLPEWGGGGAIGRNEIVVPLDRGAFLDLDMSKTLVHELTHIVIARTSGGAEIPRWFHEGCAMCLCGDISYEESVVISKGIFSGRLLRFQSIDAVNGYDKFFAELAYAQSRLSVDWLEHQYGMGVLAEILKECRNRGSFDQGVHAVLQLTPAELESGARAYILAHHGRFFWIIDEYFIWGGITLLMLISYTAVLFKKRRRFRAMGRSEQKNDDQDDQGSLDVGSRIAAKNVPPPNKTSKEQLIEDEEEFDDLSDYLGCEDEFDPVEDTRPFDDDDGGEDQSDEVDDFGDDGSDGMRWWEDLGFDNEEDAMRG